MARNSRSGTRCTRCGGLRASYCVLFSDVDQSGDDVPLSEGFAKPGGLETQESRLLVSY